MITKAVKRLEYLCILIPDLLRGIKEEDFADKPSPEKWSKKEILGHLIDSAANNHQRFIPVQFEDMPSIVYEQDKWNKFNYYDRLETGHLISFCTIYNQHLTEIIKRIPEENLGRKCRTENDVTLLWLIEDYVDHLEHHLRQVVDYK